MIYLSHVIVTVLAIVLGQATKHLCKKMPAWVSEEISFKEYIKSLKTDFNIDVKYTIIYIVLFNLLVYLKGINLALILQIVLIFSLMLVFSIDYRYELIPDECHIIIALAGLVNLFFDLANWKGYLIGALIGGGSFYILGLLALIIYKKEGMGFGDVKLMAALGLFFGIKNILVITILSFAISAVVSILLIVLKKKKLDSYIPFGPFIVVSTLLIVFFNANVFIDAYYSICMFIGTGITDVIFKIIE